MSILSLFFPAPKDRPGIYRIDNRRTGWFYIGATTLAMTKRWDRHHNKRLQADWNKYGLRAFKFSVIETVKDADQVFVREEYWQRKKYTGKCYNPHPDAMPTWIKKKFMESRRAIEYSTPESQEALVTMFRWVHQAPDELSAALEAIGFPESVLVSCRATAVSRGPLYPKRRR